MSQPIASQRLQPTVSQGLKPTASQGSRPTASQRKGSSSAAPYQQRIYQHPKTGHTIHYCSCPAWKFQKAPLHERRCKHINTNNSHKVKHQPTNPQPHQPSKPSEPQPLNPAPMRLGRRVTSRDKVQGWWLSRKYDGIWVRWQAGTLRTRSGRLLQQPEAQAAAQLYTGNEPLDGELWSPEGRSVAIATVHGVLWSPSLQITVFDWASNDTRLTYAQRYRQLQLWSQQYGFQLAPQITVDLKERNLATWQDEALRLGLEGWVLRDPMAPYRPGQRSREGLKLKPELITQAQVLSCELTQTGKTRCWLQEDGRRFAVMVSHALSIGSSVQVKHMGRTETGLPEFPVVMNK